MFARAAAAGRRVGAGARSVLRIGAVVVGAVGRRAADAPVIVGVVVAAAFKRFLMLGRGFLDLYRYCCSWPDAAVRTRWISHCHSLVHNTTPSLTHRAHNRDWNMILKIHP